MYWARHDTDPVLYWPALEALLAAGPHLLVECGPGQGLTTLARRHRDVRSGRCAVLSLLGPPAAGPDREAGHLAAAIARLGRSCELPRGTVEHGSTAVRQAR
jgi:acyl transferase domain-containing protein